MNSAMQETLLRMERVGKSFSGTRVLDGVDFDLVEGEVHVLAGENGAGKSTLIKIISGVHAEYDGAMILRGQRVRFHTPHDAYRHGVSAIFQELSLVPSMSVIDNLFLGRETSRSQQREVAKSLCNRLSLDIDLDRPVEDYPLATRQLIEVAKALAIDARILIMDEPTSALNGEETERLFAVIRELKQLKRGIIYISHRMDEIYRIADRITVLRDGKCVGTKAASELPRETLIQWMIGRELTGQFPPRTVTRGPERFEVSEFSVGSTVSDVSFNLRRGEILGVAGLQGAGVSDLMHGLFGAKGTLARGSVVIDGESCTFRTPADAMQKGVALLTNDRKATGLVGSLDVCRNITLGALRRTTPGGWLQPDVEEACAARHVESLSIRTSSLDQDVMTLSGGNQQKVLLARWIETLPRVLLLDEPTRGVDVGAKHEIYALMNQWTSAGMAILLATSEMEELLAMSDRIMVLFEGRIAAMMERHEFSQSAVLQAAMGMTYA